MLFLKVAYVVMDGRKYFPAGQLWAENVQQNGKGNRRKTERKKSICKWQTENSSLSAWGVKKFSSMKRV
jgi:hypothetical protein